MQLSEQTIILEGQHVLLRPLILDDLVDLIDAVNDGELDKLWFTAVPSKDNAKTYIEDALNQQKNEQTLVFAVICQKTGNFLGSSRFCNLDLENDRAEIGYTWYRKSVQRTQVNTETKMLLLQYAFEKLNLVAVEFRTHWMNLPSRNAILRLGAKQDGVLRNHRKMPDGSLRDTVIFSIIASEWLAVKHHLSFMIHQ